MTDASPPRPGPLRRAADVFTSPLAAHVSHFREPFRTALTAVAAMVAAGFLASPSGAPYRNAATHAAMAVVAATFAATLVPRWQRFMNRFGGLLMLAETHALVALTGGPASPLRPAYLLLLVYGAAFYGTRRVAATVAVVLASMVATASGPHAGDAPADPVELAVTAAVWAASAAVVHILVVQLRQSAHTDPLTGLVDHGTFWDVVALEHERADRNGTCYSVLLVDLDHFKAVNDEHGHQVGDDVLRCVGAVLRQRTRALDVPARYGGEEFAVVLSQTGSAGARRAAEKARRRICSMASPVPVTASVGVATYQAGDGVGPDGVVAAADGALYAAKAAGRNRVEVATR